MPSDIDFLRRALGEELDDAALTHIATMGKHERYQPGDVILAEGEQGNVFHVLLDGRAAVSQRVVEDSSERQIAVLEPGQFFGELALLDRAPRMATVRAVTDALTLALDESDFHYLLEEHPQVAYGILRQVVHEMRRQDELALHALQDKNVALELAYRNLQAAQEELVDKERLEHELALAATVQQGLLPRTLPQFEHFTFAAYQQPARQVGGDFFDVIELGGDHVGLLLADVADKGMHAALIMAVTRTLFRVSARTSLSPADVVQAVHRGLLDAAPDLNTFVTAFYGVLHLPSGLLTYVRAAQERPLLSRPDGKVTALPGDGRFIGMLSDLSLSENQVSLSAGDRLLIFSDGVTDAVNKSSAPYGYDRLQHAIARSNNLPVTSFVSAIVEDITRWEGDTPPFDDVTLLGVAVR